MEKEITEGEIVKQICHWLAVHGHFFWRCNNIPVYGRSLPKYTPRGLPDIFVLECGMLYGLEVKRPAQNGIRENNGRVLREGKLSLEQAEWGILMRDNGGVYACVRSLDDVKALLHFPSF